MILYQSKDGDIAMLEKEIEYIEHIKQANDFTKRAIRENGIPPEFARVIFEKCLTSHHYFIKNNKTDGDKPSERQLKFANDLKIENPEQYNKKELSELIKEKANK